MTIPATYAILGRGRLGLALHASLRRAGAPVRLLPGRHAALGGAAVWVLAVPDRALPETARRLLPHLGARDVVLHLAGILGPGVLIDAGVPAARAGSLHPLVSRSSARRGEAVLPGAALLFEGGGRARGAARALARRLGATLVLARSVDRARYHAGAALLATGAAALSLAAADVFTRALTPAPTEPALRAMIASLLESVAANVRRDGPRRALASPLLRRDTESVARHLSALRDHPGARALYRAAVEQALQGLGAVLEDADEVVRRARAVLAEDATGAAAR